MKKTHYPNIEKAFEFKIEKSGNEYRCETNLQGSSLVGVGKTKTKAKYNLLVNWLYMIATYEKDDVDSGYVPIILKTLKEDIDKLGEVV